MRRRGRRRGSDRGVGLPGQVWAAARPVWIADFGADGAFPRHAATVAAGLRGALGFPIVIAGQVVAVVEFFTHALRQPDRQLDAMLTVIGGQVGQFIERERLLASEREARAAAESANRAKDNFIAVLSHELRTPLSPVTTGARLLEEDAALSPEQREVASMIRRNAELEARLIDDLLDVTRISRGKISLHLATADAHDLIRSVCQMVGTDAVQRELTLAVEPDAAHHHVRADAARFQQVLWNLVKNAVKFTPPGGRVTVRTANPAPGRLDVVVRDTGRGIDPAVLPHIFNAFEQGGADVTHRFGGLGLGLAISKGLVDLHGGTITAHSDAPGAGATFTVSLPTCKPPTPKRPASGRPLTPVHRQLPATPTAVAAPARRLLLVEDHADTAKIMARLLGNNGYHVVVVHDVTSALRAADHQPFDLLISDLGLPDGSGLDLMRELMARHRVRGIALTGYGRDEDVRKSAEAGFTAHLTKPVDVQRLKHLLRELSS